MPVPPWSGPLVGFGLAAVIAFAAWRAGSLSRSGAAAAVLIGGVSMTAGRSWGGFLVIWFVVASLASRIGRRAKESATGDVVAKGGRRDAAQVAANGGVYAVCALFGVLGLPEAVWAPVGAAALVAAGADTLATETGTLWRGQPWSFRTFGPVPTGTSGAVSVPGTLGMIAGAAALAAAAAGVGLIPGHQMLAVAMGGVAGAVADTLIGAWWQARRWCPACTRETEQLLHRCGTATTAWRGVPWLDNDVVNFLCTAIGAAVALALTA